MKKLIIILVLVIVGVSAILYFSTRVIRVPELEYKYKRDETLYYVKEIKKQELVLPTPPLTGSRMKGATVEDKYITMVTIKGRTINDGYVITVDDLVEDKTGKLSVVEVEGAYNYPYLNPNNMSRKGDIVITGKDMFLGSQPRFGEEKKRGWKNTIYNAERNLYIPVSYKIVKKEGDKYRIKTSWEEITVDNEGNEYSNRLKGYSDFNANEGKIIQMKSCTESRKNGELYIKREASWRLMTDDEVFKLSGFKRDWELVAPDGVEFDLSKEGKIVYKKRGNQFTEPLCVSNGDGSQSVEVVTGGLYPRWSPDGNMIAYTRGRAVFGKRDRTGTKEKSDIYNDLFVVDLENNKEELLCENINSELIPSLSTKECRWSPDSKWIGFYVGEEYFESEPMMVNVKTKEVKKIEKENYPLWHIDIHFTDKDGKQVVEKNVEVQWSPDGKYMAVGKYRTGLFIISREDKEEDILIKVDPNEACRPLCWSSDGKFIVFRHENEEGIYKISYNIYSLEEHKVVAEVIKGMTYLYLYDFEWSYDGKHLYFRTEYNIPETIEGIYRLKVPDEIARKISKRIER